MPRPPNRKLAAAAAATLREHRCVLDGAIARLEGFARPAPRVTELVTTDELHRLIRMAQTELRPAA